MYLEKLEVQGFKSFANKNQLNFPGMLDKSKRGITAVVGPNGSGKSNVADSVRWALGEQSMKTLRGKKSEDIIFAGTEKKGKLGMAEVSLFLNNEDKQAPVDFSEIVLTRRLYRNGDSEYLLNNSKVRLADIQMLLARAKFGQKTYSVIGQGMVEGFLNTSLAERKEFFDEATGVKQYQIKRDEALNKLRNSYENLHQAEMLMTEIEPRLRSLTRQVNRLRKRDELEKELKGLQAAYYTYIWHQINDEFAKYNKEFLEIEKLKFVDEKKMDGLTRELDKIKQESGNNQELNSWRDELSGLNSKKEDLNRKIARAEAKKEMRLESAGKFDLAFLLRRKEELKKNAENIQANNKEQLKQKDRLQAEINAFETELRSINVQIENLNKNFKELEKKEETDDGQTDLDSTIKMIWQNIEELDSSTDIVFIKKAVKKIKNALKPFINNKRESRSNHKEWNKLQSSLLKLNSEKENIFNQFNSKSLELSSLSERIKLNDRQKHEINKELSEIETKMNANQKEFDAKELDKELNGSKAELDELNKKIVKLEDNIRAYESEEEAERNRIFALQKEMQDLQNKLNDTNNQLHNLKISSTRYETKLEDLEIEIREELNEIKAIKEAKPNEDLDLDKSREKISNIKKQLELIGGIDPQTEEEYKETKERYDFLKNQVDDFSQTVESLRKIIKELDVTIKKQFDKEFKVIAVKFEEYFKVLFNGGNAKIIKVMAEDEDKEKEEEKEKDKSGSLADLKKIKFLQRHNATGLAGIEIQACPPGKKIKSITMLSGGERALTAIALICAIISANPSPFVVLDEVDAALDEANSERLAKILDELSHKTQFIVITHNRASMRRANILYGVTMGDDGVSKLLSVKLDDVKVR